MLRGANTEIDKTIGQRRSLKNLEAPEIVKDVAQGKVVCFGFGSALRKGLGGIYCMSHGM